MFWVFFFCCCWAIWSKFIPYKNYEVAIKKAKISAIKNSSYPIQLRVLSKGKWWGKWYSTWSMHWTMKFFEIYYHGTSQEQLGVHVDILVGAMEGKREIIHINCKRCHRGQILPEVVTASFCVKFLDRKPPACWWILNGNQSWLNKCLPLPLPLLWINSTLFIQFLELTEC